MAGKTNIAPESGKKNAPVKLVLLGEAPAGIRINVPPRPENIPVPPEQPPEEPPEVPPGLEIRDGRWVITVKPTSHSARDTPITDLETIHSAEVVKRSENEGKV